MVVGMSSGTVFTGSKNMTLIFSFLFLNICIPFILQCFVTNTLQLMYMYLSFKKSCLSVPKVTAFNQQKSYALVICMHRFLFMLVELWDCCSSPVLPVFPLGKIPKHLEQGHTSVFSCLFVFPFF